MQQLELLLTMVLIPYIGKYFGRKLAFWGKFAVMDFRVVRHWLMFRRLGEIYGVEVSGRYQDHFSRAIQSKRYRCSGITMKGERNNDQSSLRRGRSHAV